MSTLTREINTYVAMLLITIAASAGAMLIVQAAYKDAFEPITSSATVNRAALQGQFN